MGCAVRCFGVTYLKIAQSIVEDVCRQAESEVSRMEIQQGKCYAHDEGWDALHQVPMDDGKGKCTDNDGYPASGGEQHTDDAVAEDQLFGHGAGNDD